MNKQLLLWLVVIVAAVGAGVLIYQSNKSLMGTDFNNGAQWHRNPGGNPPEQAEPITMTEAQARAIAQDSCVKGGEVLSAGIYNENSKTWWFDANLNDAKLGCNPACVVSAETKTAEINWRCTGAIPPSDGNGTSTPTACTMEAKICPDGSAVGRSGPKCEFAPCPAAAEITVCSPESRQGDVCAQIFAPVCATVQIQCVTTPCNPIKQTFSNPCEACHNQLVSGYVDGECAE